MINPTPLQFAKYQVIAPLGGGSFGQVYHAFDHALATEKAVKVLFADNPESFMQHLSEAQILNKCKHKHIVAINEANIFAVNGTPRIVLDLEYVAEGSLEKALAAGWVTMKDAVGYVRGALRGLEHAHAQGFLHRDVKPGNILLSPMTPKLSDFGLATAAGSALVGSAAGYQPHLPPEFYQAGMTTQQTDVFAMGITLFRALSNIADWPGMLSTIPNLEQHYRNGTLVHHVGFQEYTPSTLQRIVRKACHPDPTKRFFTAHALGQSLDALRFDVDWVRCAADEWRGVSANGKQHACLLERDKNELTVTVNGRRVRPHCKQFATLADALAGMNAHLAATTLA